MLRHRSNSRRRAMPAAIYGKFRIKAGEVKQMRSISAGAGFEAKVPGYGAGNPKYSEVARGFPVIRPTPMGMEGA